jgi:hypothetical protein
MAGLERELEERWLGVIVMADAGARETGKG